jgi:hypothetical protein
MRIFPEEEFFFSAPLPDSPVFQPRDFFLPEQQQGWKGQ